jgi:hypothetical protein
MSRSLTGHSAGRIFLGLIRKRGLVHIATILSFAMVGLATEARAVPVTCDWSSGLRNTRPLVPRARAGETVAPQPASIAGHCVVGPQFFVGLVGGPNWMNTTFSPSGSPAFNVNAFGGSINPYMGVMVPVSGLNNVLVGGQVGYIGSNVTGDTFYPFSGGTYATTVRKTISV